MGVLSEIDTVAVKVVCSPAQKVPPPLITPPFTTGTGFTTTVTQTVSGQLLFNGAIKQYSPAQGFGTLAGNGPPQGAVPTNV